MNIILIGFKGIGKSTLGRIVAQQSGMNFLDTDKLIEDSDNERRSVRQIFFEDGEREFRQAEAEAVEKLKNTEHSVISTGGGTLEDEENLQALQGIGKMVYLKLAPESILARIKKKGFPPFFDKDNPEESFWKLFRRREKKYLESSDLTVDISGLDRNDSAKRVITELKKKGWVQ